MRTDKTALEKFESCGGYTEQDPVERLRFYCSLAISGRDWLDIEPFFDALKRAEPAAYLEPDVKYPQICHKNQVDDEVRATWIPLYTAPTVVPDSHEFWAAAQLVPGEGIDAGVSRIETMLSALNGG